MVFPNIGFTNGTANSSLSLKPISLAVSPSFPKSMILDTISSFAMAHEGAFLEVGLIVWDFPCV
jgi:hypothetical protein